MLAARRDLAFLERLVEKHVRLAVGKLAHLPCEVQLAAAAAGTATAGAAAARAATTGAATAGTATAGAAPTGCRATVTVSTVTTAACGKLLLPDDASAALDFYTG